MIFCGIIAPLIIVFTILILGELTPGYSHVYQLISELGAVSTPFTAALSTVMTIVGLFFILFAIGIYKELPKNYHTKMAALAIGLFGLLSGIGSAIFPCDGGCLNLTARGWTHEIINIVSFSFLTVAPLLAWQGLRKEKGYQGLAGFSLVSFVLGLIVFIFFAVEINNAVGFYQRIFLIIYYAWIEVLAVKLFSK